jgi:hypothetical protein
MPYASYMQVGSLSEALRSSASISSTLANLETKLRARHRLPDADSSQGGGGGKEEEEEEEEEVKERAAEGDTFAAGAYADVC